MEDQKWSLDTLGDTFEMEIKKTDYTRKNSQNGTNRAQMETIFEGLFLYIVQRNQVTENRFVVIKMNCLNETKLTFGKTNKSLTYTCVHQIWFYFVGFIKNTPGIIKQWKACFLFTCLKFSNKHVPSKLCLIFMFDIFKSLYNPSRHKI
ncbi:hypothetical protein NP493_527g01032 [Ridgeia piscesae]|uniref:Uncharacterized protein n=1 Tax=Ridgeia piscesae TaxID=27915 RepID=A0AAD9KWP6_RIDPI|nr:hypothetical protein NP493_527g01032 [Ridgeia piscesae]